MFLEILGIILIVIAILIVLFFTIFSDSKLIFWYLTGKKKFKYKVLRRYSKNNKNMLFLGTLHDMHFNFDEYGFHHLKAILTNYKPDVLLVESRQDELDLENYADGPIEMYYLTMIAKDFGIEVKGVDWYDPNINKPGTTNKIRDEHILSNIEEFSKQYTKPLVVIGATHLLLEDKMLKEKGYQRQAISKSEADNLYNHGDKELVFHKDTPKYIDTRINRLKEFENNNDLDEKWSQSIKRLIEYSNRFKENYKHANEEITD